MIAFQLPGRILFTSCRVHLRLLLQAYWASIDVIGQVAVVGMGGGCASRSSTTSRFDLCLLSRIGGDHSCVLAAVLATGVARICVEGVFPLLFQVCCLACGVT